MFNAERRQRRMEDRYFRGRIAAINGLSPREVDGEQLKALYDMKVDDTHRRRTPLFKKYIGFPFKRREEKERAQGLGQLTETLLDLTPEALSYGLFARNYIASLRIHERHTLQEASPHRSLLVGALTRDTIHEYERSVKSVYSDATCLVNDIDGIDTKRVDPKSATFFLGDGTALPVNSGSVDSVHTNILLRNLKEPEQNVPKFLSEAHRVLSDNGFLIMVEEAEQSIYAQLETAGFTDVIVLPAATFNSRREMTRFLHFGIPSDDGKTSAFEEVSWIIASKMPKGFLQKAIKAKT